MKSPKLPALFVFLLIVTQYSFSQIVNGRFISSVYAWEKFDTVDVSKKFARGFQSVLLDVGHGEFSLHTHVQGATALQRTLDEVPDIRFFYLYGRWRNIANAIDVSFGRQSFFVGVGVGSIDGLLTNIRLDDGKLRFTAYGGANVPDDIALKGWKPLKNNFTVGGQLITTVISDARIGISYINRHRERPAYWTTRPDSLFNPLALYVAPEPAKEQYLSADVSYRLARLSAYGRYDYDMNAERTQRAQLGVRVAARDDVILTGDFIHRAPRVPVGSFFSLFAGSTVNEFEAGADHLVFPSVRMFVRGAYVSYDDDESVRYTFGVAYDFASATFRGTTGYAGELASISIQGTYPLLDRTLNPTLGFSYASYRFKGSDDRTEAYAAIAGAIVRPVHTLSFDVQVQWLRNKIVDNDVRLFGKVNYWFSERLHLFD